MPKKGVKTVVILCCLEHGGCEGFGLGHGFSSTQHSFRGIYCGSFNPPVFLGRKWLNTFCFTEESNDVVQIWSHFEVFFFLMIFLGCQIFPYSLICWQIWNLYNFIIGVISFHVNLNHKYWDILSTVEDMDTMKNPSNNWAMQEIKILP